MVEDLKSICGVDEVGRGPLAGPVVAAAVVLPTDKDFKEFTDSKKLTEKKRDKLFSLIIESSLDWCIAAAGPKTIDKINIREATKLCMKLCIEKLNVSHAYVDGNMTLETNTLHSPIIKGDQKIQAIGAASIIAKVWRDTLMKDYDKKFPGYNFSGHKGYPSKAHKEAISKLGPCPIHRYSFRPLTECTDKTNQLNLSTSSDLYLLSSTEDDNPYDKPINREIRGRDSLSIS